MPTIETFNAPVSNQSAFIGKTGLMLNGVPVMGINRKIINAVLTHPDSEHTVKMDEVLTWTYEVPTEDERIAAEAAYAVESLRGECTQTIASYHDLLAEISQVGPRQMTAGVLSRLVNLTASAKIAESLDSVLNNRKTTRTDAEIVSLVTNEAMKELTSFNAPHSSLDTVNQMYVTSMEVWANLARIARGGL